MTTDEANEHVSYLVDLRPDNNPNDPCVKHCAAVDAGVRLLKREHAVQQLLAAIAELPRIECKPCLTDGDLTEVDEAARLVREFPT